MILSSVNMGRKSDYIGQRFGRLAVIADTGRRQGGNVVWRCRCDCGNITDVPTRHLAGGNVVSCGCHRRQIAPQNIAGDATAKLGIVYNTNVSRLRSHKPPKNNTSGVRGVCPATDKRGRKCWVAYIYFQRRHYHLGTFYSIDDAAKARREAEENIHGAFLEWYYANHPERKPDT